MVTVVVVVEAELARGAGSGTRRARRKSSVMPGACMRSALLCELWLLLVRPAAVGEGGDVGKKKR